MAAKSSGVSLPLSRWHFRRACLIQNLAVRSIPRCDQMRMVTNIRLLLRLSVRYLGTYLEAWLLADHKLFCERPILTTRSSLWHINVPRACAHPLVWLCALLRTIMLLWVI